MLFCLDVVYSVTALVQKMLAGTVFELLAGMKFIDFQLYWNIFGSFVCAWHLLFSAFVLTALLSLLIWIYQKIMRLYPVPTSRVDFTITKADSLYIALGVFVVLWLVVAGIGVLHLFGVLGLIADESAQEMVRGITILVSPVIIVMGVGGIVMAVIPCVLLVPCSLLFKRMLDFIMRPSSSVLIEEVFEHEQ